LTEQFTAGHKELHLSTRRKHLSTRRKHLSTHRPML